MGDDSIKVTATTVRIPVMGGQSESVDIEFAEDLDLAEVPKYWKKHPALL
jgi:aspartate-semialdehyde dehydrogenase